VTGLKRFLSLPLEDKILIVCAVFLLPLVGLWLRVAGLRLTQFMLGSFFGHVESERFTNTELARRYSRMIDIASRRSPFAANCLERSLVLWFLLRRKGADCQLRLGARKKHGNFEAHAWVEAGGLVVNDSGTIREVYPPFECAMDYISADH